MGERGEAGASTPRRVHVPGEVLEAMLAHARRLAPAECCGALVGLADQAGDLWLARTVPLANTDPDPARYRVAPEAVRASEAEAARTGLAVVGFYHSHPAAEPRPSDTDLREAWPWYAYLIVDPETGSARAWRLREDRAAFQEEVLVRGGEPS